MRRYCKWVGYTASILLLLLAVAVGYAYFSTHNAHTGTLHLAGLKGPVNVEWDEAGVPHIHAKASDEDAFFAMGYIHAMDRFWQIEMQRRIVSGRLSELFGDKALEKDKFLRTWGFYRAAQTDWPALNARTRSVITAYTAGVNAFLQHGKLPLPIKLLHYKPEPWTVTDTIAIPKLMAFDLQSHWVRKIRNQLIADKYGVDQVSVYEPPYPENAITILSKQDLAQSHLLSKSASDISHASSLHQRLNKTLEQSLHIRHELGFDEAPGKGSNNWVVSGKLTQSGKPVLADDPHLTFSAPLLWYLAEIDGPTLQTIGATIPGVPGIVIGRNQHIAWGVTNANLDTQDLYIEPASTQFKTIKEVIKVCGKPDVTWPVLVSKHGPVISDVTDAKKIAPYVALKWTALQPKDTTFNSFMDLSDAKNWSDFKKAMQDYVSPSQNFVFADDHGNIGYYAPGKVPLRNWDARFPVEANSDHEWGGFVPFEKMPHVYNPPEGYIITANNKITPDDYVYDINFRWAEPQYRAERIHDMLTAGEKMTPEKSRQMQLDTKSYAWRDLQSVLQNSHPVNETSKSMLNLLSAWDGRMDRSSSGATAFAYWYQELSKLMPAKIRAVQQPYAAQFLVNQLNGQGEVCKRVGKGDCQRFIDQALNDASEHLAHDLGTNPQHWAWGRVHRAEFIEMALGESKWLGWLWNRTIPSPGGLYTVNVGTYSWKSYHENRGPGYRQVIDFSDQDRSKFMQALGQSNDVFSPHYADLMKKWRDGQYLSMQFSKIALPPHTTNSTHLRLLP